MVVATTIFVKLYDEMAICTSQSPIEDMEDSVEPGIRVTKETGNSVITLHIYMNL